MGRARLTMAGNVHLTGVVFGKKGAPLTTVSRVVIDPHWLACLQGRFEVESLSVALEDGILTGKGTLADRPFSFHLEGTADHFPLGPLVRIYRDLPKPIRVAYTGSWRCSGTPMKWRGAIDGHLDRGVSIATSTPRVSCVIDFDGSLATMALTLGHQQSEITSQVTLDMEKEWLEADFKVKASPLSSFDALWSELSQTQGTVVATGHVVGPWAAPAGTLVLDGDQIRHKGFGVKTLQARFHRIGAKGQPFNLNVSGSSLTWVNAEGKTGGLTRAEIGWKGTFRQGDLTWTVLWDNGISLKGQGPAHRKGQGLSWAWKTWSVGFPSGDELAAVPGGTVDLLSTRGIDVRNLRVGKQGHTLEMKRFYLSQGTLVVDASADHFDLTVPASGLTGRVSGDLFLQGPWDRPEGHFEFKVSGGSYGNITDISGGAKGRFENGLVAVTEGGIGVASLPSVRAWGTLPWAWILATDFAQPMDIAFETDRLDPLELLKNFPEAKGEPGGFIQIKGRLFGPKAAFSGEGTLAGSLPYFEMPSYGIVARETNIDIELKDRHFRVRKAETNVGKGPVRVSGEGDLPALNLDLEGTKVSLLIRRHLELVGDLRLHLGGTLAAPHLKGDLAIAQGTYEVTKKKKTDGVVAQGNAIFKRLWTSLAMNVQAGWPNNVWYRDGLTKIETRADLEVIKGSGDSKPGLRGLVTVLKGNYDAYGRDFVLKTGELTFMDSAEINPQLNLQATHKMKDYLIELTVLGTVKNPDLQFQSTPPLQEQDILALLAVGKVPGQSAAQGSTSSEGAPSEAAELAADVVSNYLTREIRSAGMNVLDLDVVRVSPSDKGNEWTVGRYWGSKLFLSYSYTPEDAANQVLKAEYSLTPRWTFVGQTGSQTDNYLDLTFRLPVGKSKPPKK